MFKEREIFIAKINVGLQVIFSIACFLLVWVMTGRNPSVLSSPSHEIRNSVVIIGLLLFIIFDQFDLGNAFRPRNYLCILKSCIKAILTCIGFLIAFNLLLKYQSLSFDRLIWFGIINTVMLIIYTNVVITIMQLIRKSMDKKQILILADEDASTYLDKIIGTKDWGIHIRAIVTNSETIRLNYSRQYNIIPDSVNIREILDNNPIDEVVYCRSANSHAEIQQLITDCDEIGVGFHYQARGVNGVNVKSRPTMINQLPFISYRTANHHYFSLKIKSVFDFFFSLFAIILTAPVQAVIAILIKLDDGGPAFFKQERVGLNGRKFYCLKFRTMVVNAEALKAQLMGQNEQQGPVFKITLDPRVTRIGKFLRKTSLDELPQFINVLRGEMSIVGPRPPLPSEVEQYERWQIRRLSMKPGITCIWQVSGRNNIPFYEWMKLDLKYIDEWSLKLDMILILKTLSVMLTGDGK